MPAYHRLQEQVAAATIGRGAARILDLGTGTGVTARSVLRIHPRAQVVGIDESPEMLAAARHALPPEQFVNGLLSAFVNTENRRKYKLCL